MAGHSHWAQIKHKKEIVDKKRSQIISKLVNLILVAAKDNPNPETNPKLKSAIEKAKEFGVSQEVIERNLNKLRDQKSTNLDEIILEAYAPEGVALIIKCLTNNRNRTISEIKQILLKHNAKLAEPGSVIWMFKEEAVITIEKNNFFLDKIIDLIDDFSEEEDKIKLFVNLNMIYQVKYFLEENNINILSTEIQFIPKNYVKIENKEKINNLITELLDYNEVYEVYSNQ